MVAQENPRGLGRNETFLGQNDDATALPCIALKNRSDHGEITKKGIQSPNALVRTRSRIEVFRVGRDGCSSLRDHQLPEIWPGRLVVRALTFFIGLDEN